MTLAILTETGEVITDPEWHTMSDVMRGAHGMNIRRVTGQLIELGAAASAAAESLNTFVMLPIGEERCEYSWLFESQCAHCLGHVADWEEVRKPRVYE